jgi:hypothetical protein
MAERKEHDVEFLEYVVKSIVDHPDDVKLTRTIDEMGVLITLAVNPEDMGHIIGRAGGTAKSIRTLLRVIGARNNARVNLKILEPEGSGRGRPTPPADTPAPAGGPARSGFPPGRDAGGPPPATSEETPRRRGRPKTAAADKEAAVDEAIQDVNI